MDLKRAWRNGFLVTVIFAIPLSDLYYNQIPNFIVDDSAKVARVQLAENCGAGTSCSDSADGNVDDISGASTSWDNNVGENALTIPGETLADLLVERGDTDFSDLQKSAIQFDPQDLFLSERIGEMDMDIVGRIRQNSAADFASRTPFAFGFANPSAYAAAFSGPFTPTRSAPASGDDSEASFVPSDATSDTTTPGIGDGSLHNVPEPSSFVLIAIGTISVASLLHRKSKTPAQLS